jgi:hypothetical protein
MTVVIKHDEGGKKYDYRADRSEVVEARKEVTAVVSIITYFFKARIIISRLFGYSLTHSWS